MREDQEDCEITAIIARHVNREGPLLPILHDIQDAFGHVGEAAKRQVALALNLSRAEVHGVVSFYHDFKNAPEALPVIKLCRAEACQARGSEALTPKLEALAAGRCKVETVYCLGLCSVGPNALAGGSVYAHLDETTARDLIAEVAA
ncbi:NAD(P)H-dependent oxidoreductase subunit E [Rhizorhapis suberifaciens]|uniref:Formate dehydrogenase subunit gamma n=1 Tax=Rhizorhapis suberifaciens TaxID=13656 RepID=A0A840HRH7_9SPHN|nr:NAD(P)H-dependent oxidoreductase subunit E [Rhizorhapis suberifaciens]MBB4640311.1 formate dehydrogenase subunit gamma [Rhizorhapis suberifaciens]